MDLETGKILVGVAVFAVFCVLCVGIYSLYKGGDFARSWSNKLMRLRIILQAVAVLLLMVGMWLKRTHAG